MNDEQKREKAAKEKAKKLVQEALKRPVHLRVPVNKERAENWLAQRNALGLVLYDLFSEIDEDVLEDLRKEIHSVEEQLCELKRTIDQHVERHIKVQEVAYQVVMELLANRYSDEGYNAFDDDLDESWHSDDEASPPKMSVKPQESR
jgi:hypothetical protein